MGLEIQDSSETTKARCGIALWAAKELEVLFLSAELPELCKFASIQPCLRVLIFYCRSLGEAGLSSQAAGTSPFARTVLQSGHFHKRKLHLSGKNSLRNIGDLSLSHRTCGPGSGWPQFPLAS